MKPLKTPNSQTTCHDETGILFTDRLEAHLTPIGALRLLATSLRAAPEREAVGLCDAFLAYHSAGYPIPSFLSVVDDAKWHASIATPSERKAYCLAHFQSMNAKDQAGFLSYVGQEREAA